MPVLRSLVPPIVVWLLLFGTFAWLFLDDLLALGWGTDVAVYVAVIGGMSVVLVVGMTAFLVFAFGVSLVLSVEWLDDRLASDVSLLAVGNAFWAFLAQAGACIVLLLVMPPPALSMNYDAWWQLDEELASLEALEYAGFLQFGAVALFLGLVVWRLRRELGVLRASAAVGAAASAVTFVLALFSWVAPEGAM